MIKQDKRSTATGGFLPPSRWHDHQAHFSEAISGEWYSLLMQISGTICYATNDFFRENGFLPALMPITSECITSPMGLGSDSLPVAVELFGKQTYLADSMQFHLEYLLRQHPGGVFYIMPTFRGEDPDARHLNQFFHIEAEFCSKLDGLIQTIEGLIGRYAQEILKDHGNAMCAKGMETGHLQDFCTRASSGGLPRIRFEDAVSLLGDNPQNCKYLDRDIIALTSLAEQRLMDHFGGPVWLTHLPKLGVPFYQADAEDGKHTLCADLLMGIGETVGCGQRQYDYGSTLKALKERLVSPEQYGWYLRMKKEFPLQTSGFGIGLERLLLWIFKHNDIRDMQILVRLKHETCIP